MWQIKYSWKYLWLNVIIALSRCLFKIAATNHTHLTDEWTIVDQKRVRWAKKTLSSSLFLSFSPRVHIMPIHFQCSFFGRRPAIMSRVNGSLKEATPERPFSANKGSTYANFIFFFHINFIADFNLVSLQPFCPSCSSSIALFGSS